MQIGEPIEEQCVRMYRQVFGNLEHSLDDARRGFYQQEPSVIAGWERLAKTVCKITTPQTIVHVEGVHR